LTLTICELPDSECEVEMVAVQMTNDVENAWVGVKVEKFLVNGHQLIGRVNTYAKSAIR